MEWLFSPHYEGSESTVVIDVIGTGGMGIVFRAEDPNSPGTDGCGSRCCAWPKVAAFFDRFSLREMKSTEESPP